MRYYIILFFLIPVFLLSCGKKEAPPGILKADNMVSLLTDVHLVDGSLYSVPQQPDTLYKVGLNKYLNVFKLHHTDSLQFRNSMQYYSMHPDEMEEIYTQVTQNLQNKLDTLNKTPSKKNAIPPK
jgi:hypothetical protein